MFQEILVDRAVHAAIGWFLPSGSGSEEHMKPLLVRDDFSHAMHEFLPVAMRDITKSAPEVGRSGWDDVGGLNDIRDAITEVQVSFWPSKLPMIILNQYLDYAGCIVFLICFQCKPECKPHSSVLHPACLSSLFM